MEEHRRPDDDGAEPRPEPRRPKRWPTAVAVLIVLAAIAGIVLYERYVGRFKRSEPYRMALESIQKAANANERLGTPIKDATSIFRLTLPSGLIDKDRGQANLAFKVSGPKGKADVWVQARRIEGKWFLSLVEITPPGEKKIPIDIPAEFAGDTAPKFDATQGGGGVEPPKARPPRGLPGKPGAGALKEPAPRGSNLKIDIPDLDAK
jgi:hypothetical protein